MFAKPSTPLKPCGGPAKILEIAESVTVNEGLFKLLLVIASLYIVLYIVLAYFLLFLLERVTQEIHGEIFAHVFIAWKTRLGALPTRLPRRL